MSSVRKARPVKGATKYGAHCCGLLSLEKTGLNKEDLQQLEELVSHSVTKKTWSNYKTAERLFRTCCKEKGISFQLPVSEKAILSFILWLVCVRRVTAGTVDNYLSGIRQLHIVKG